MKEDKYQVSLDDNEHGIVIRCLNDKRNELIKEGKYTDAVDDLLVKVGNAPKRKTRVKDGRDESR